MADHMVRAKNRWKPCFPERIQRGGKLGRQSLIQIAEKKEIIEIMSLLRSRCRGGEVLLYGYGVCDLQEQRA